MPKFHPILSCSDASKMESDIFKTDSNKIFDAMQKAGNKCAELFLNEFENRLQKNIKILVVAGNGHNGGDALVMAKKIALAKKSIIKVLIKSVETLTPETKEALSSLLSLDSEIEILNFEQAHTIKNESFDILLDGIAGMNFKAPARESLKKLISLLNTLQAQVKVSIDIPSGASEQISEYVFKADITYATASLKKPLIIDINRKFAGRIRYADIGIFNENQASNYLKNPDVKILSPKYFKTLNTLRNPLTDKRDYGHLFVIGGSLSYKGAVMLNVKAALRAGVGIVTAFVPQSIASEFAAIEPSAIWVSCPEDENGAIALESLYLIKQRIKYPTAILAGSGITQSPETKALLAEVLKMFPEIPCVLDADAICKDLAKVAGNTKRKFLMTPHEGEFLRLSKSISDSDLKNICNTYNASIALKSSITRISDGKDIVYNVDGSPILSRGGSGDILAGIAGALSARKDLQLDSVEILAMASKWLGCASEIAHNKFGENSLSTNEIIQCLSEAFKMA